MTGFDITPSISSGRQAIESYGNGRFRIGGALHRGSVLVWPEHTVAWPVRRHEDVTLEVLTDVTARAGSTEILVVGCGPRFVRAPARLQAGLRETGIALEWMDTGAACRTFNVLLGEERRVAAALIAVD